MTSSLISTPQLPATRGVEKLAASPFSSDAPAAGANQKELFQTAQKWVGQTFFGTLLKQMHESPFKSELWSGGRGGEAFSTLYDQHLAERMARASGRPLANAIVKHIQRGKTAQVQ
jgi:Rod binding domain-containing protein